MWRNTHERDSLITFDAENHIYHIRGIQCTFSSTGLVAQFFPKFDMIKVIDQYYDRWQKNNHPKYGGKTKDEILESWADIGEESSVFGTRLHEAVESFYKGEEPYIEGIEEDYALFTQFQQKYPQLIPYRIEWRVGTEPDIGIAGSIDMCFVVKDKLSRGLQLVDWKRTKKAIEFVGFRNQMGLGPLKHLPDTNYYHYAVQLNIYKYILENYYGLSVATMQFVVLHRNNPNFLLHRLPDLQAEIRQLFAIVKEQRQVQLIM